MAGQSRALHYLLILAILLSSAAFRAESRVLNAVMFAGSAEGTRFGSVERLVLRTIKHSGPSPSGPGHRFVTSAGSDKIEPES